MKIPKPATAPVLIMVGIVAFVALVIIINAKGISPIENLLGDARRSIVSEVVVCVFTNPGPERTCTSGRYTCTGIEQCSMVVHGPIRKKLTWTTNECTGASSIIDGQSDVVVIACPPPLCDAGYQPYRYNAGGGAHWWTVDGAYNANGTSSLWTSGVAGTCCEQETQCAFPTGCQRSGAIMGNYSYMCHADQGEGVIFGCAQNSSAWNSALDGKKLFDDVAYCCSKFSAELNKGPHFHALAGNSGFAGANSNEKREITRPEYDACIDGSDNDCDGLVDAQDPDCTLPITCPVDGAVFNPTNPEFMSLVGNELQIAIAYHADLNEIAQLYKEAGVKNIRIIAQWSAIEQTNGSFDWGYTDQRVSAMSNAGINVIGIISDTPQWASSCSTSAKYGACVAANQEDYKDFVRTVVRRYGSQGTNQIHDWEIRVEPTPGGTEMTKEQYVQQELNVAYAVIHREDFIARVWGPEVPFHRNSQSYPDGTAYQWVAYTIANGQYDVFSIHQFDTVTAAYEHTKRVREMLDAAGQEDIPLAITAMSVYYGVDVQGNPITTVTPQTQAQSLTDLYACVSAGGADYALWFCGTEWTGNVSTIKTDTRYGILDYGDECDVTATSCSVTPKPAYYAYKALSDQATG